MDVARRQLGFSDDAHFTSARSHCRPWLVVSLLCSLLGVSAAHAADIDDARELFRTGKYDECSKIASAEADRFAWSEDWRLLKIECDLVQGRYADALASLEEGLRRIPSSLRLRLLSREVYLFNGRENDARAVPGEIERLVLLAPQRYATAEGRVGLGRFFLMRGADPRKVLDQFYDVVRDRQPDLLEVHFATAELALDKQDDALAADTLRAAPKTAAEDPRFHYLMARAFAESDRSRSIAAIQAALEINPRHVDSLLLQANHLIDSEQYDEASRTLDRVLAVNPHEPRAWAYRAVLAHLKSEPEKEKEARDKALAHWSKNPEVDHIIGRELSQKYRFAEGAAYQKRSLELDVAYRPAKLQLGQDLLRLGQEEAGWTLLDEVHAEDGYNVVSYNLITLRDEISGFETLRSGPFVVRMDPREAVLYGDRVLALLEEAQSTLCAKYDVPLHGEVLVEIFPKKNDFAVRTFGLPGADGFLGVCFGRVITVNSPASQGESPTNWESVVWHEFCHTVTLTKTRNKMPRWLSEGISVYEEGQRNPAWATPLSPQFREMILGDDFTPLSELSSAFLAPKSALHLQFAYFESALAVEFLIGKFGLDTLKTVLDDLGDGIPINETLPVRTNRSLEELDGLFALFARDRAKAVAPNASWKRPEFSPRSSAEEIATWVEAHPTNFFGWQRLAAKLVSEKNWSEAVAALETMRDLYPEYVGPDNAYELLAVVHRNRGDKQAERSALEALASKNGNALRAFERLAELAEAEGQWKTVAANAEQMLAVNPLVPAPHRFLARAAEKVGKTGQAIEGYRALSLLDETDPAEIHFRLATLLRQEGHRDEARREVLKSLEEAPRFLEAHALLLDLVEESAAVARPAAAPVEATKP